MVEIWERRFVALVTDCTTLSMLLMSEAPSNMPGDLASVDAVEDRFERSVLALETTVSLAERPGPVGVEADADGYRRRVWAAYWESGAGARRLSRGSRSEAVAEDMLTKCEG